MAEASTRRFRDGVPLSIFDGVPVGFKEEYSVVSSTKLPSVYFEDSSRGLDSVSFPSGNFVSWRNAGHLRRDDCEENSGAGSSDHRHDEYARIGHGHDGIKPKQVRT